MSDAGLKHLIKAGELTVKLIEHRDNWRVHYATSYHKVVRAWIEALQAYMEKHRVGAVGALLRMAKVDKPSMWDMDWLKCAVVEVIEIEAVAQDIEESGAIENAMAADMEAGVAKKKPKTVNRKPETESVAVAVKETGEVLGTVEGVEENGKRLKALRALKHQRDQIVQMLDEQEESVKELKAKKKELDYQIFRTINGPLDEELPFEDEEDGDEQGEQDE